MATGVTQASLHAEHRAFAGLERALEAGVLSVRPSGLRARRFLPETLAQVQMSRENRVRLGLKDARSQTYQRTKARA